ncbi:MAG TPA: alpha-amylase family glycosyl hydrolase [Thermoleophilaceae bacterium]|nr:alpha-amylase family glycosyl hydrolase [Thermoleophilaceae bacterium]
MRPQPVIYQIYPRSFQDSDGDGVGDLAGVRARLDHLVDLGVDALWLSPFYPSPLADFGYDVADYKDVDSTYGTLSDFDALVEAAHARGLEVLLDMVPCHTSIEHPWFREHPDWYIWADEPNNWPSAFGGPAWTRLGDGYYLHSFYPEQPDLDWRNPEVVAAMQDVLRFWLDRGADGYRLDAIHRLLKDPQLRDDPPASEPFGLPLTEDEAGLALTYSRDAPDIGEGLARIREACGDAFLVGEVYLPSDRWGPYLDSLDAVFAFELLHSPWQEESLRRALEASTRRPGAAWVMSNHDFGRLATRFGHENARAAAMLTLTLPGPAFLYQGDEIAQRDGPPGESRFDRAGRDRFRHPMQWDGSPNGGFTGGQPWLPPVDPEVNNMEAARRDPSSTLSLVRNLIALRPRLGDGLELLPAEHGVLAYRRGEHVVAINTTGEKRPAPRGLGEPVLATHDGALHDGLAPHAGAISR